MNPGHEPITWDFILIKKRITNFLAMPLLVMNQGYGGIESWQLVL